MSEQKEETAKNQEWAQMDSEGEEEQPKDGKKVAKPKKNAAGDYVVTKIEIDDKPVLKEVTRVKNRGKLGLLGAAEFSDEEEDDEEEEEQQPVEEESKAEVKQEAKEAKKEVSKKK